MKIAALGTLAALCSLALAPATARAQDPPPITQKPANPRNYSVRSSRTIDRIVIHKAEAPRAMSVWSWFQNPRSHVSAHYVVDADGSVYQMVPDRCIAMHAGNHLYNSQGIGIENAGYTVKDDISDQHMRGLARLTRYLCDRYRIPRDRAHIVGHNEVPDPNHKGRFGGRSNHDDPGKFFNWVLFMKYVNGDTTVASAETGDTTPGFSPPVAESFSTAAAPENADDSAGETADAESAEAASAAGVAMAAPVAASTDSSGSLLGRIGDMLLRFVTSYLADFVAGLAADGGLPLPAVAAAPASKLPVASASAVTPAAVATGPPVRGIAGALGPGD